MDEIVARSPDMSMAAVLTYDGEMPYGPAYFMLKLGRLEFPGRIFGHSWMWSTDSRYFAIQEWLTTDYGRGPHTHLLLVEPKGKRASTASTAQKGFVEPLRFEPPILIYRHCDLAQDVTRQFELDVRQLHQWHDIAERQILLPPQS
jgi:hypothetical protein